MKRTGIFLASVVIMTSLATGAIFAGGNQEAVQPEKGSQSTEAKKEVPSVALLLPGSISDHGWNYNSPQSADEGERRDGCQGGFL
jgi:basic membrane lipoprotein Med (substrate-binding protein (PBP1-ABC) superfamily)